MRDNYSVLNYFQDGFRYRIEEDNPDVGWYIYVYDKEGNCIADHLQDSKQMAVSFCKEKYNIPEDNWEEEYT